MSQTGETAGDSGSKRPVQPDDKSNVIITPAGPIPRDKVHPVGPGETVRRKKDGSLEIVPENKEQVAPENKGRGERE
jgi:hypothetical protein